MSINLTDEIKVKTKKGKLGAAKQIFLEGDMQNVEKEIQDINSRHSTLNTKHESLSKTVQGIAATGGASTANNVTYNNDISGLNAENAQDAIDELQGSKVDKTSILQESGEAEDKVMSQKAVSDKLSDLVDNFTKEVNRVNTELGKKTDKTYVDTKLNKKGTHNVIEEGFHVADERGNVVLKYDNLGLDVALLSEHIKNLIKTINGVGFPDDVRLMLLNTIISSISENSWNLIDNNYNIAVKYDILGFDVAKINKHFKRLIDSVGFAEIAKLYSSDNPYGVNYTKYYISGRERFIDKNNIIPLFIVAGQSNAVGAETQDHSPEWLVRGKLENYNMWNPQQHAFSTYNIVGNNGGENGGTSGNFGFDIYFAKQWLDTYGTPIYACKVANGGTAIGYKQGVSHCWNADIAMLQENNCTSLCEVFINRIQDIFEWGIQNNKIIVPIAILWLQGETDAVYGFQNDYQTNLSAVFSLLRGCLGSNTIPIINAPIEKKSESARATINAAYTAMNNLDKNFFTINTDDFIDGTHYNYRGFDYHFLAEGYKEIGERMFTIYKNNFNL